MIDDVVCAASPQAVRRVVELAVLTRGIASLELEEK